MERHQEKHCFAACSEDKVNSGLCDCINRMRNENNMTTKTEFINKWKCWWMLQKQGAELTDAFEKELNAIIEQEIASKNLVKADVIGSLLVEIKSLLQQYRDEEMPDWNVPFHYDAEGWASIKHFMQWLERKSNDR